MSWSEFLDIAEDFGLIETVSEEHALPVLWDEIALPPYDRIPRAWWEGWAEAVNTLFRTPVAMASWGRTHRGLAEAYQLADRLASLR